MLTLPEYQKHIIRIRKKIPKLKSNDTKLIYQWAEHKINEILIRSFGIYFNSRSEFEQISKINVIHLRNILEKLHKGDSI